MRLWGLRSGPAQYGLLLATIVIVGAFLLTRAMDAESHNRRLRLLLELQAAEAALDRDVLRVTSFLLQQFDPLVKTERRIRARLRQLEAEIPEDRVASGLRRGMSEYRHVLEEKLALQEHIKSQVALVRNGLLYLPLVNAAVARVDSDLGSETATLLNELYRYNLFPSSSLADRISVQIDELELFSEPALADKEAFKNLVFHMRANLNLTGGLSELESAYVAAPSGARFDALYQNYTALYAAQVRRANVFTLLLLGLTLGLFLILGVTLGRLHRARAAAERAWTQLRDAVESLSEAFALFAPDGRLVLHNRRYQELYPWLQGLLSAGEATLAQIYDAHRAEGRFREPPRVPDSGRLVGRCEQGDGADIHIEEIEGGRWYRASDSVTTTGELACVRIDISEGKRFEQELRKLYRALEQSPASVIITDADGTIEYANPKVEEITGYKADEVIGKNPRIFKSGDKSQEDYKELWETIVAGKTWRGQFHNKRKDGSIYWEAASISPVRDEEGRITHFIAVKEDITARKRAEEQLRMNATVFETTTEGIMVTDADNRVRTVNPAFTRITGYRAEEIVGRNPRILSSGRHDQAFYASLWETLARTGYWHGEIWNRRKDGSVYPEWMSLALIRDDKGQVQEHVAVFSDISQRKEDEAQIRRQANYDALTGLPNRSLLFERVDSALRSARREKWIVALLFVDLDRFKVVNDSMGHVVGDELLRQVAQRLNDQVRDGDTVARFGGDEFVLLLEDIDRAEDAAVIARKVITSLENEFSLVSREVFIGASVGITLYPVDADDAAVLLRNADMAMYRAKEAGRNTYRFYTKEMNTAVQSRMDMERELRLALERDQLSLDYQPIVRIDDGTMAGLEALLRWRHPRLGQVPPAEFVPLLEETGFIREVGGWVLSRACAKLAQWRAQRGDLRISVNLSSRQIALGLSAAEVLKTIDSAGLPPDAVTLEITEGLMLEGSAKVRSWLEDVHTAGVGLAVDDFGTGYSSLGYLKRFPMDRLKIDRSFVLGLPDSREDALLVRAIHSMATSLDLKVVAEGIETAEQAGFLADLGCELGQGFLYSRPVAEDAVPDLPERFSDRLSHQT